MARVRGVGRDEAPVAVRQLYDCAPAWGAEAGLPAPGLFRDQVAVLAHRPGVLRGLGQVYEAFGVEATVPRRYHELAVLCVSALNACRYCVAHHAPYATQSGLSSAQVQAVTDGTWRDESATSGLFDETERLVLKYAAQVTTSPVRLGDDLFTPLRRHFDDGQIVELTLRITLCSFWNKFNDALGLSADMEVSPPQRAPSEPPAGRE